MKLKKYYVSGQLDIGSLVDIGIEVEAKNDFMAAIQAYQGFKTLKDGLDISRVTILEVEEVEDGNN